MEQQTKTGPKEVFLNLLVIVTLYVSVISFIALLFQYISYLYPDRLNFYFNNISNQIRLSSAALIVVFPVFIFLSWLIGKDLATNPSKRELKSRLWLIYLTLFISAITIIVDLVTMIYNFYSGDLTIQFFLKILVIFVVAGAVFGYYAWELKRSFSPARLNDVSLRAGLLNYPGLPRGAPQYLSLSPLWPDFSLSARQPPSVIEDSTNNGRIIFRYFKPKL